MAGAEAVTSGDDGNRMRCACVDIGTNTTRLLVAEAADDGLRKVVAVRRFARLTATADGSIPAETVARLGALVAEQVRLAREHGADEVRVVATAAIRRAPNRAALCAAVQAAAGVEVEVLTGTQEAELAFVGALSCVEEPTGTIAVIDVGGGSSEIVVGTRGGVQWSTSLDLGSGTLAERHVRSDPPALEELAAARAEIDVALATLVAPAADTVLAVGGSATSLAGAGNGTLAPETIARVQSVLLELPVAEAAHRLGLHEQRVKLLPTGLLVLEAAWEALGRPPLRVVKGGLREGVLLRALDGRS